MRVDMATAIEHILNICERNKVPVKQYNENEFPDGCQTSDDVITVRRFLRANYENNGIIWNVKYVPWIRVMPNIETLDEYDTILEQGIRVRNCIQELEEYLNSIEIYE